MRIVIPALVLVACSPAPYQVTQVGTVPAVRPMAYDGQPLQGATRVEGRSTTVLTDVEAEEQGQNSGLYVARQHSSVAIRGGFGNTDAGLELDIAWNKGSQAIAEGLGPRPSHDTAIGFLMAARHSFPLSEGLRLGVGFTMGFFSVPVRVGSPESPTERDEAGHFALAFVPSWTAGNYTVFGGMNIASEIDVPGALIVNDSFDSPEARAEGGAIVMSAGATARFDSGLRLTAQMGRSLGGNLADYGLQADLIVGFEFGAKPRAPYGQDPQPVYYPPPAYPQPYPPQPYPQPQPQPTPAPAPAPDPY